MTGVAGRSQGCKTCRRRKVKCDLKTPVCQNCSRFGRKCEGYARYPVFINRTQDGVAQRRPFEETKTSPTTSLGLTCDHRKTRPFPIRAASPCSSPCPQILSKSIEASPYLSWFHDSFVQAPSSKDSRKRQTPHWLDLVFQLNSQESNLDEALLAISLTRFGHAFCDPAVLHKGRQMYARALGLLQKALRDEHLSMLDETLATVGVMILYELLETTPTIPEAWSKHIRGLASLLKHRGPQRHSALVPFTLFENSRYMLMINSIAQRKATIFAEPEWQQYPWHDTNKTVEQMVFDSGLQLGCLLEEADKVFEGESVATNARFAKLLSDLARIVRNVNLLCRRCPSLQMKISKRPLSECYDSQSCKQPPKPVDFPLKITALGIQLTACVTGHDLTLHAADQPVAIVPVIACDPNAFDIHKAKEWYDSQRKIMAREICCLSFEYLRESLDLASASRTVFPLRLAFEQLDASDAHYTECRALLQRLGGNGRGFVPALNRNESITSRILGHKSPLYGYRGYCWRNY